MNLRHLQLRSEPAVMGIGRRWFLDFTLSGSFRALREFRDSVERKLAGQEDEPEKEERPMLTMGDVALGDGEIVSATGYKDLLKHYEGESTENSDLRRQIRKLEDELRSKDTVDRKVYEELYERLKKRSIESEKQSEEIRRLRDQVEQLQNENQSLRLTLDMLNEGNGAKLHTIERLQRENLELRQTMNALSAQYHALRQGLVQQSPFHNEQGPNHMGSVNAVNPAASSQQPAPTQQRPPEDKVAAAFRGR